ncbi:hypothetical protein SALB1_1408 [Salinisphaera sp. LB1]|nr:hypothetical protein SALB1_1408 [Salinisphaera sp. LB1]
MLSCVPPAENAGGERVRIDATIGAPARPGSAPGAVYQISTR